jgi:aerobic C4-dicarboxylate transport protein
MAAIQEAQAGQAGTQPGSPELPFYRVLWVQVLLAIVAAVALGYLRPERAVAMKPLGDAFVRLVTMIITLIIFCTVVTGIAGMENLKKVGRVGGMALLYFEVVSTLALLIGLLVGNLVHPGSGFNVDVATLDVKSVADYAGQARAQTVTDFLMHIIPTTVFDPFTKGDILQVVLIAILFGFALATVGPRSKLLVDLVDALTHAVFGVVNILMKFAPIGAFGAMAYTVGKFGLASLGPRAGCNCLGGWLQHLPFPVSHQGGDSAGAGDKFVRNRDPHFDVEAGTTGLFEVAGGTSYPNRLHLQH